MTQFSRPGPQLTDMLRRLRARPVSSWHLGDRQAAMRAALQRLADLAAEASGGPHRAVPDVGVLALPDQLAVLLADAQMSGAPAEQLNGALVDLGSALSLDAGSC